MKLTAGQFQDIVALLNATSAVSKHEKRRESRIAARLPATIIPCDEPDKRKLHTVVVLDISAGGVGIVSTISLDQGRRFILRIAPRLGHVMTALQYTVAHSRKQNNGAFIIGARFERLLSGSVETPVPTPLTVAQGTPDTVDSEHLMLVERCLQASLPNSTERTPGNLKNAH